MAISVSSIQINVVKLGANSDGRTDSSKAFLKAWESACSSPGLSTINVPKGRYLIGSLITFSGAQCKSSAITFRIYGTLVAPTNYFKLSKKQNWIMFHRTNRVSIIGGTLDARGSGLWACKNAGKGGCPTGVTSLQFSNSKNVLVSGLTSLDSQMFHIVVHECNNVKLQGTKIRAIEDSPNTDGIHISHSSNVRVMNANIGTGDDCVSIGPGSTNLWVQNITCGPGHGISIGSLGRFSNEPGVQNITVSTATFTGTQNGVRIKTWAKPSTGFVKGVMFQHLKMVDVQNPVIIDQQYCNGKKNCPHMGSGIKVSDVTYQDIRGTSASKVAVTFKCNKDKPCSGIKMRGVTVKHGDSKAAVKSECANVVGVSIAGAGCNSN
ncbi:polygalacturonase-like [Impatiens glandulifera]|uniref:polygalacturonase-like n=1 Tax=Impatiens glandulifera TaxID=253017 RepID=UPI001FB0C0D8|nr:polygalacturonase-like [Impatiens glandulifera]